MGTPKTILQFCIAITLIAATAGAATFVVPSDRDLIRRADAIVIGSALVNYSRPTADGGVETVTSISVEQVIKGSTGDDTLNVVEPGGVFGDRASIISGVPRFTEGQRMLLLLNRTGDDRWAATELVLGKFTFRSEGQEMLLVRDEAEIVGWDPDLKQHRELRRSASDFLQFVRDEVGGRLPRANYFTEAPPSTPAPSPRLVATPSFVVAALAFSANSYTMALSGSSGGRWKAFPNAVNWFMGTTQEPGAPGGGATAITTAFASWNNDAGSNVNYVYAGVDNGSHTSGLHGADGANTILFERDLSSWGAAPFTCSGGGYSGTLGMGGISQASGTNTVNGETFWTTQEGDVEMNKGIANCTTLFNNGDWNTAITHEFGHTLGFRHSDQNRASNGACSATAGLDCSSSAVMTAVVTHSINAALQAWDVNAVRAVYPGAAPPPPPPPPAVGNADTPGLFRPSAALYFLRNSNTTGVADIALAYGIAGDVPVAGDWNGDGVDTVGVYRNNAFLLRNSNTTGIADIAVPFGIPGDVPLAGDWNGDGIDTIGVRRGGAFLLRNSNTAGGADLVIPFGLASDIPIVGDWNGDGTVTIGVYRPSTSTFFLRNSNTTAAPDLTLTFGMPGDTPLVGDWNGDGVDTIGVRRGAAFLLRNTNSTGSADASFVFGIAGDTPVVGNWDGLK